MKPLPCFRLELWSQICVYLRRFRLFRVKDHENTEAAACTGSMPRSNIDWLKSWLEQEREK